MKTIMLMFVLAVIFSSTYFVSAVTCEDSDGSNIYQKGTIKGAISPTNDTVIEEKDYCSLEDISERLEECDDYNCGINEWECIESDDKKTINSSFRRCSYGCNDGKCLKYESSDCDYYHPSAVLRDSTISFNEHKIVIYLWGGKEGAQFIILQIDGEQLPDKLYKDSYLEFKDIRATVIYLDDGDYTAGICLKKISCPDCDEETIEEETDEDLEEKFFINGKEVKIEIIGENNLMKVGNFSIESSLEIIQENEKVYVQISGNKTEIKILPEEAIEEATIENIEEIKIEEHKGKAVYLIKGIKKVFLFFVFPINAKVEKKIDIENAELISIKKPWWSFLALGI